MLVPWVVALAGLVTTKRVSYRGATYGATIVPATAPGLPALVLLPPIGVGSDRMVRRLRPRHGTPRGSGRIGTLPEARPPGAQPLPRLLELAAPEAAHVQTFGPPGIDRTFCGRLVEACVDTHVRAGVPPAYCTYPGHREQLGSGAGTTVRTPYA